MVKNININVGFDLSKIANFEYCSIILYLPIRLIKTATLSKHHQLGGSMEEARCEKAPHANTAMSTRTKEPGNQGTREALSVGRAATRHRWFELR